MHFPWLFADRVVHSQIPSCTGIRVERERERERERGGEREGEGHVTRIHAPPGGQTLLVSPSSVAPRRKSPRAVVCDANLEQETSRLNFEGDFSRQ